MVTLNRRRLVTFVVISTLEPDPQDSGCSDLGFWELYTRWIQYGTFLPMFRSHGTDASREIWRFGDKGNLFYNTIEKYIYLRYQFIPYIYSLSAQVTQNGSAMLRAVGLDFPEDVLTHDLTDEFLFGPPLLVCPVTSPMYYENNSQPIATANKSRLVYLPAGASWFNFWTGECFSGGQNIEVDAPLDIIPLFVRSVTILPMGPKVQYASQKSDEPMQIHVYPGADGSFELYEDEGDNYNYEQGKYSKILFNWDDSNKTLIINDREGEFEGMAIIREFKVVLVKKGSGFSKICEFQRISYVGFRVLVRF